MADFTYGIFFNNSNNTTIINNTMTYNQCGEDPAGNIVFTLGSFNVFDGNILSSHYHKLETIARHYHAIHIRNVQRFYYP